MKKIIFLLIFSPFIYSYANECNFDETLIASCNFSGETNRKAIFCEKNGESTRYFFKKNDHIELEEKFYSTNKLKRWKDLGTYTTYFGFNKGAYSYILGVPEERPGVVAFLDVRKNGKTISSKECDSNSFGNKDIKSKSIEDVPDSGIRDNNFRFP